MAQEKDEILRDAPAGKHYKHLKIEPIEYIHANAIPFEEASAIKYLTRWRDKGGVEDLKKARFYIDYLIEQVEKNTIASERPPERQEKALKSGDSVINKNPASLCHGLRGVFIRYWSDRYAFYRGRGCDVEYSGVVDLYGRVETAQSVADLELAVED